MIDRPTVLLVEDDGNDVLLFEWAFAKAGLRNPVQRVYDGEEAVRYLEGNGRYQDRTAFPAPGLIILDLRLPRMAGLEVLAWMRGRGAVPVVVLTSSGNRGDRAEAARLEAAEYHVKPVTADGLVQLLQGLSSRFSVLAPA